MKHIKVHVNLSKHQENKIHEAIKNRTGVKLRLSNINLHAASNTVLILTSTQYDRLKDGKIHDITIPYKRLTHLAKHGGILPIIPILGALGALAGIGGGVAGMVSGAKGAQKSDAERKAAEAAEQLARLRIEKEKSGKGLHRKYII